MTKGTMMMMMMMMLRKSQRMFVVGIEIWRKTKEKA
jgi:hypothetical protein